MASVDNLFGIVSIFALAIICLVGMTVWNVVVDVDDVFDHNPTATSVKNDGQSFYNSLDSMFVLFFFGLHLGVIILALALRSHPIIYPVGLILITLLAVLAAPISNAYETVTLDPNLVTADAQLSMTGYIMDNLPPISIVMGFITLIVLAGLARQEGFF